MMSLWDALRMNMMISYQELVRTFHRKGQTLMPHLPENNAHFVSNLIRQTQSGEFIVTSLKLPASS
ncbi:hypothetical protein C3446_10340 [Escherichia coli]|nr:hypothetical protein C3446_10340 [Escherichia coli]